MPTPAVATPPRANSAIRGRPMITPMAIDMIAAAALPASNWPSRRSGGGVGAAGSCGAGNSSAQRRRVRCSVADTGRDRGVFATATTVVVPKWRECTPSMCVCPPTGPTMVRADPSGSTQM